MLGGSLVAGEQPTVAAGSASVTTIGNERLITVSDKTLLEWASFNIPEGHTTRFVQPGPGSVVWNQVTDPNPSTIFGRLEANGIVVLANSAGFHFGPNSYVEAASLVVVASGERPPDFSAGGSWGMSIAPTSRPIVNYGTIKAADGGSVFLISNDVRNHGTIEAVGGQIGLHAGKEVLMSERPDGRGLTARVTIPEGAVDNGGRIVADGGSIAMEARVVNNNGLIQANSVKSVGGTIELVASDAVQLGANSRLVASGQASGPAGGEITVRSGRHLSDVEGSIIDVSSAPELGGQGGVVHLSAPELSAIRSTLRGGGGQGEGGRLEIDPQDIVIAADGAGEVPSGVIPSDSAPGTLRINPAAFDGFSQIHLQATRDITVAANWTLSDREEPGARLRLEAGRDIRVQDRVAIVAGSNWSVEFLAGVAFNPTSVVPGNGSIQFLGIGSLETRNGDIRLSAGGDVTVGAGYVRTMGGGDIHVQAVSGSINTGTRPDGFTFVNTGVGYTVAPTLGGISTGAGGDVELTAGTDILSFLPVGQSRTHRDGGSGAFGAEPGDVRLTAGRDILGHYVVRNGEGVARAGQDVGNRARPFAVSLVSGGWSVEAARDILLQEARNPNGTFNSNTSFSGLAHVFDYDPRASLALTAGNGITLSGEGRPRTNATLTEGAMRSIYPPRLDIHAGAGGIQVANSVSLFPSAEGQLEVTTSDGGSLRASSPARIEFGMSDSGKKRFVATSDFSQRDHSDPPIHLGNAEPVRFDISGNIENLILFSPKVAEVRVRGDIRNATFHGQNLRATDVTRIEVDGEIWSRSEYTFVDLDVAPTFRALENAFPNPLSLNFTYDAETRQLGYGGRMTLDVLEGLLKLQNYVVDYTLDPVNGTRLFDALGQPLVQPATFTGESVLRALYDRSQDIFGRSAGYQLGGPGAFEIKARDIDLGMSEGILSRGPEENPALARLALTGADIRVETSRNLSMIASSISSRAGGSINVVSGGSINVGSAKLPGNDRFPRGIFTTSPADVSVISRGNIDINGSRIAAYDGGSILVRSLEGNVDAGSGESGFTQINRVLVDPVTRRVTSEIAIIPGSGILATTFPSETSETVVGNITVETPRGSILASKGGVVQLSLNHNLSTEAVVKLSAGSRKPDGSTEVKGGINAGNSGVIGSNVALDATGDISGVVLAKRDVSIDSKENVNVTALASGNINVSASGSLSGTLIGVGALNVAGASVDAALLSTTVNASGSVSSSQVGFSAPSAAAAPTQTADGKASEAAAAAAPQAVAAKAADETNKPRLKRRVGRVTVILPPSS